MRWKCTDRDSTPEDWARTVALLGAAQVVLGERDSDPAWLNAALNSYRLATSVYTREAAPTDWARMQRNCGAVLSLQGERTGDTACAARGGRSLSRRARRIHAAGIADRRGGDAEQSRPGAARAG